MDGQISWDRPVEVGVSWGQVGRQPSRPGWISYSGENWVIKWLPTRHPPPTLTPTWLGWVGLGWAGWGRSRTGQGWRWNPIEFPSYGPKSGFHLTLAVIYHG